MNKYNLYNYLSNINQKVACMLVGNKVDMGSKRAVTFQEGKSLGIINIFIYSIKIRNTVYVDIC